VVPRVDYFEAALTLVENLSEINGDGSVSWAKKLMRPLQQMLRRKKDLSYAKVQERKRELERKLMVVTLESEDEYEADNEKGK
jgi:hypothetical protein